MIRAVVIGISRSNESDYVFEVAERMRFGRSIGFKRRRKVRSKVNGGVDGAAVSAVLEFYYSFNAPGGFNAKRFQRQLLARSLSMPIICIMAKEERNAREFWRTNVPESSFMVRGIL